MQSIIMHVVPFFINFLFLLDHNTNKVIDERELEQYSIIEGQSEIESLNQEIEFWQKRLVESPKQYSYKLKIADYRSQLFQINGSIDNLNNATLLLEEANRQTYYKEVFILRSLARNYISQHRFRDAYGLLCQAESIGQNLRETQKMLFDVHMELGNYHVAGCYLAEIRKADFDYFIRMAKWQDFLGNLDHAIHFMELAADQAEKQKNRELMLWSYTNLADFYGHAGRISDAYSLYKKSLQIQPGNRYALKQIAWIAYSYERNTPMALEIVSDIEEWYCTPDILLLKAQILDYLGDKIEAERYAKDFLELVRRSAYGRMYTIQIAELFLEEKKYEEALTFALKEVEERPTPETYGLLAWVHFNAGHLEQAYQIIEDEIVDKTFEPVPNYYAAEILKSKGKIEYVRRVKDDLMESIFELGPDAEPRIKKL